MTPQEQQIWDMVHKFCEDLYINIPDMNRRYLMDKIQEYGNYQWNAALEAAKERLTGEPTLTIHIHNELEKLKR